MNRLATLDEMHEHYSDLYKSVYGIRPRWVSFDNILDAGDAILSLEQQARDVEESENHFYKMLEEKSKYESRMGLDSKWIPANKFESLAGEP
jgi:hypothetical protein